MPAKNTRTLDNETKVLNLMESLGRPPTLKEIQELLDISDKANASKYLQVTRDIVRERLEVKLNEVSDSLVRRIKERVEDTSDTRMRDENLIKLLEFVFPKKTESVNKLEQTVDVGSNLAELKSELDAYSKLLPETTNP
jgi:hypothetical protein